MSEFERSLIASLLSTHFVKNGIRSFVDNKSQTQTLKWSIGIASEQTLRLGEGSGVHITASHFHIEILIISYSISDWCV